MYKYPQDCEQRKIESKSCQIFHSQINTDHWAYKQEPNNDVGRDCILELSENDLWKNHKIECQIKGTKNPNIISNGKFISFAMEIKTINYALSSHNSFLLFLVNLNNQIIYYQSIQDYFINNPTLLDKLRTDQKTLNIRIDTCNILANCDKDLQKLAVKEYTFKNDTITEIT